MSNSGPIFIVGAPRSGTSLLRNMLNRHPSIWLCDETRFGFKIFARSKAFGDLGKLENRQLLVDRYIETNAAKGLGYAPDGLANALLHGGTSYKEFFTALIRYGAVTKGCARFGEKTPGHAFITETLCEWYPDCLVVHIVRDPRDVVASLQRMPFGSDCIASNTRIWKKHVVSAETSSHRHNFLQVRYESLIEDPESILRRVLERAGEEYTPLLLEAGDAKEDNEWWFERANKPLQSTRIGKWRGQLSDEEVSIVEWLASDEMSRFGYDRETSTTSLLTSSKALFSEVYDRIRVRARYVPILWYHWIEPTKLADEDRAWETWMRRGSSLQDDSR